MSGDVSGSEKQPSRHSGQARDSGREPESRPYKNFWIPAFAGKTDENLSDKQSLHSDKSMGVTRGNLYPYALARAERFGDLNTRGSPVVFGAFVKRNRDALQSLLRDHVL